MAVKAKRNKRSLVTLKRTEPSNKEKELNEFIRLVINGEVKLEELIPEEDVSPQILAKYPTVEEISHEMTEKLTGDMEHDSEIMDEVMTKYESHPLSMRIQMTLLRELANRMTPEQKEELYAYATAKNSEELEPDDDLNTKISETAELLNQGRKTKGIKNLKACIRRIEAKHTPHEFNGRPVLSLASLIEEKLFFADQTDSENTNYYQPPADYALAYEMYAEMMMEDGEYVEAFEALNQAVSWNPVNADSPLKISNMLIQLDDSARAIELLDKAYSLIVTPEQLLHFYMQHSAILLNEDNEESIALAVRLQRLSRYLTSEDAANIICEVAEQLTDNELGKQPREAFIEELKNHNIPFGASENALKALRESLEEMEPSDTRNMVQETYEKLSTCFDALKEI